MATDEEQEKRISEDLRMFDENVVMAKEDGEERTARILDLAKRYRKDAEYYMKKKDYVTSFGCINYAHGLLDALIKW